MSRSDKIKATIGVVSIIALILGYVFELPIIFNTLNLQHLLIVAVVLTLVATFLLWYRYISRDSELYEQFVLVLSSLVLGIMVFPLLLSLTNRLVITDDDDAQQEVELLDWSARSSQPYGVIDSTAVTTDGYQLIIKYNDKEAYVVMRDRASFQLRGDKVSLPIKKGILGFAYVPNN